MPPCSDTYNRSYHLVGVVASAKSTGYPLAHLVYLHHFSTPCMYSVLYLQGRGVLLTAPRKPVPQRWATGAGTKNILA